MTTLNPPAMQSLESPTTSTIQHFNKNQLIAYENNKQVNNNPLKDISNRVVNQGASHFSKSTTPPNELAAHLKPNTRYSIPFEIAPKQIKINNYLEQSSLQKVTTSIHTPNDRSFESPF